MPHGTALSSLSWKVLTCADALVCCSLQPALPSTSLPQLVLGYCTIEAKAHKWHIIYSFRTVRYSMYLHVYDSGSHVASGYLWS